MKELNAQNYKAKNRKIKIMQFGEGNFLRAFVDWILQDLNDKGVIDSNVVVVQPMPFGRLDYLAQQDGLYTVCLEGIDGGKTVKSNKIIDVLGDFINPFICYDDYLKYAESEDLQIIISNTTEAGIALDEKDTNHDRCPVSFPGKLLALLHKRYVHFNGDPDKGLAIIPCELIDNNGTVLKEVLNKLAQICYPDQKFISWLNTANHFTDTLVDRIVPGYPRDTIQQVWDDIGFMDINAVKGEVFHLWVLKDEPFIRKVLPADKSGLNVLFVPDIKPYKERKVKLLNGAHTGMVPVAYLCGIDTVGESVRDSDVRSFLQGLMYDTIAPTVHLPSEQTRRFADSVIERFENPFIRHELMSIALNSTTKFRTRLLQTFEEYCDMFGKSPQHILFSFAALTVFYRGKRGEQDIALADNPEYIEFWKKVWANKDYKEIARSALSAEDIWQCKLATEQNVCDVAAYIEDIVQNGMRTALTHFLKKKRAIHITPSDNVAVALDDLKKGQTVLGVTLAEDIAKGHKFSCQVIEKGQKVIKYGEVIGTATQDIPAGCHVHLHNLTTNLSGCLQYSYNGCTAKPVKAQPSRKVMVYKRSNGDIGIRNELWVIPTVGCVNAQAKEIVARFNAKYPNVKGIDGAFAFTHPYGCSQVGDDHERTKRLLQQIVKHPNAGGVLVLGLGCENNRMDVFRQTLGDFDESRVRFLVAQDVEDEIEEGVKLLTDIAEVCKNDRREQADFSSLKIGLKCGGSDGLSGITANPLLGQLSDYVAAVGGTTVLTEVPEMFGAEQLLMARAKNKEVFDGIVSLINNFKKYYADNGQPCYENPSPGNKAGGITTLEDKSLGCTQKSGSSAVCGVVTEGQSLTNSGLNLLNGPGNDMVAVTNLGAAGCHIVLFTTGRGTPFGGFVPTVKISTNSVLAKTKRNWIDFDAGTIVDGDSFEKKLEELITLICDVASGTPTANEKNNSREIALFKTGVTL